MRVRLVPRLIGARRCPPPARRFRQHGVPPGAVTWPRAPRLSEGRTALVPPRRRVGSKSSPGLGPVPQPSGKRAQRPFRAGPLIPRRRSVAREGRWPRAPGAGRFSSQQVREFRTRTVGLS